MAKGIDVYRYQNITNWTSVKNSGVTFVYVKATDGGSIASSPSDARVIGAKSVGLPVGGYHYAQLSPTPEQQADVFINEIKRLGALDLVPMLDLEAPFSIADSASIQRARDFGIAFCARMVARGFKPGIYTSDSFATKIRPDQWNSNVSIWIARYGSMPKYGGRYDIHQYSSSGIVPGITGSVDMNESYTNNFDLRTANTVVKKEVKQMSVQSDSYGPTYTGSTPPDQRERKHVYVCPTGKVSALTSRAWISVKSGFGPMDKVRIQAIAGGQAPDKTYVHDQTWENVDKDTMRPGVQVGGDDVNNPYSYVDQFTVYITSAHEYSICLEAEPR